MPDLRTLGDVHMAAMTGSAPLVERLLHRQHIHVDKVDGKRRSALSWASRLGHEAVVRVLLGVDSIAPDAKDYWGQTALSTAAENGHANVVRLLLDHKDISADSIADLGRTPLSYAAQSGHAEVVQLLLKQRLVNINSKDHRRRTPLSHAAGEGHTSVVRQLLDRSDIEIDSADSNGNRPLERAFLRGHAAVIELLMYAREMKNDIHIQESVPLLSMAAQRGHEGVVRLLLQRSDCSVNELDDQRKTPLFYAIKNRRLAIAKLLHQAGANLDFQDNHGKTVLQEAVMNRQSQVVQWLLSTGAKTSIIDNAGYTLLHHAVYAAAEQLKSGLYLYSYKGSTAEAVRKCLATARSLHEAGIDVDARSNNGTTALHEAAKAGHASVVEWLLSLGADASVTDNDRYTALHDAVTKDLGTAQSLHKVGADPSSVSKNGRTVLHEAARAGQYDIVNWLLELVSQPQVASTNGESPLHLAVRKGHRYVTQLLMDRGADVNAMDSTGQSPLHFAAGLGLYDIAQQLLNRGASVDIADMLDRTPLHRAVYTGQAACMNLLIWRDSNPCLPDGYGKSSLDLIQLHPELSKKRIAVKESYSARGPSPVLRMQRVVFRLAKRLIENEEAAHPGYYELGQCLKYLEKSGDARTAFEQQVGAIAGEEENRHKVICNLCQAYGFGGTRYVCLTCPEVDLCSQCRTKYGTSTVSNGCSGHEFLSVPRCTYYSGKEKARRSHGDLPNDNQKYRSALPPGSNVTPEPALYSATPPGYNFTYLRSYAPSPRYEGYYSPRDPRSSIYPKNSVPDFSTVKASRHCDTRKDSRVYFGSDQYCSSTIVNSLGETRTEWLERLKNEFYFFGADNKPPVPSSSTDLNDSKPPAKRARQG